MDDAKAQQWLKAAEAAMDEAAPAIVASVDDFLQQRVEIMKVGIQALARAAIHDAMQEIIADMITKVLPDDGGASPLGFHRGGPINTTAVRRFIQ